MKRWGGQCGLAILVASLSLAAGFMQGPASPRAFQKSLHGSGAMTSRAGIIMGGRNIASKVKSRARHANKGPVMMKSIPASSIKIDWGSPVAAGGFGAVYFAQTVDHEDVVVKVAFSDSFSERLLENEGYFNHKLASSVPKCNGRNWARFMGEFQIPKLPGFPVEVSSRRALVFRKESGQTLDHFLAGPADELEDAISLRRVTRERSLLRVELFKKVLGELLCSIAHLHSRGILHRDIKPENILVTPGDLISPLKLIDLGSGCDLSTPDRRGLYDETIDPIYAPPEKVVNVAHPGKYDSFCAAITACRVLMPSLGADIAVADDWRKELAACGHDLRAWCHTKEASGSEPSKEINPLIAIPPSPHPSLCRSFLSPTHPYPSVKRSIHTYIHPNTSSMPGEANEHGQSWHLIRHNNAHFPHDDPCSTQTPT